MSSKKKKYDTKKLQRIISQISGEIDADGGDIYPSYIIKGTGYTWCYSPTEKTMVRVLKGSKAYLLNEPDEGDMAMIFVPYQIVYIDYEELDEIGFN